MQTHEPEHLPFWKKIIYALGQLGWSLGSYATMNLLVYFYMPPVEGSEPVFSPRIYQGAVLGVFTVIGVIFAGGRLLDAITDPLVASWSDRCRVRIGRRRFFLAIAAIPVGILQFVVFYPPVDSMSIVNTIWLAVAVVVFYWFFTLYVTPFFAWLSELGHTAKERLLLSTLISITWAIGFAVGSQAITLQAHFETTYDSMTAFQIVMAIFSAASVVLMLLPVFFIEERRYCRGIVSTQKMTVALTSAFRNRNFKIFVISDLAYWSALVFFSTGMLYYVTVLMKLEKEVYSHLMLVVFAGSFLFYVPVCLLAGRIGKRKMLIFAFAVFCFCFASVFFLGRLPFSPLTQAYCLACAGAIPLAIFGILPNAVVADIAEADGILTGEFKAGMFFGARTFMQKMGQMIGALVFPSLLLLGKSAENDLGVRLTGLAALLFCLGGLAVLLRYNEKAVDAVLEEGKASSEDAVSGEAAPGPATP